MQTDLSWLRDHMYQRCVRCSHERMFHVNGECVLCFGSQPCTCFLAPHRAGSSISPSDPAYVRSLEMAETVESLRQAIDRSLAYIRSVERIEGKHGPV